MLEARVWPVMRETRPKGVTAHRIETGRTALGVADVLWFTPGAVGWCEIKTAELIDGRVRLREEVKLEQAEFLDTASRGGCVAHVVIVWLDAMKMSHYMVISGASARRLVGLRSLPVSVENWSECETSGTTESVRETCRRVWRWITGHQ